MASIGDTTRPAFAYDQATDTWVPVGVGPHSHTPAAIGAISSSVVTTKGDLVAATSSGVVNRLGVGSNNQVLTADSSTSTGLKWAAATTLGCSLWKSANQTANNVTQTPVSFNNEDFDTSGFHDNVTNNDRVTIPTGLSGKYLVTTKIDFSANATGQRVLYHFINGILVNLALSPVNSSVNGSSFELSGVYNLSAGNFIQMQVYQDSGSALNILGAAQYYTNMQVIYLGA